MKKKKVKNQQACIIYFANIVGKGTKIIQEQSGLD